MQTGTPEKPKRQRKAKVDPLLVTPPEAAERIACSPEEIYRAVARDVFTVIDPHGRGRGKNYKLYVDEVDAWGTARGGTESFKGNELRDAAVRELRYRLGRLKK